MAKERHVRSGLLAELSRNGGKPIADALENITLGVSVLNLQDFSRRGDRYLKRKISHAETFLCVQEGRAEVHITDRFYRPATRIFGLNPGDYVHIPPGLMHQIYADSGTEIRMLELSE